jgi:threonine dehydratase
MIVSLADVQLAAERIGDAVLRTPFLHSQTLSDLTGAEVWLKFENLQFTGSFKERGALNRLRRRSGHGAWWRCQRAITPRAWRSMHGG